MHQLRTLSGHPTHAAVDPAIQCNEKSLRLFLEEHLDSLGIVGVIEQRDMLSDEAHGCLEKFAVHRDAAVLVDFAPYEHTEIVVQILGRTAKQGQMREVALQGSLTGCGMDPCVVVPVDPGVKVFVEFLQAEILRQ